MFEFISLDLQDITRDYLIKVTKTGNRKDLKSITNWWKSKMDLQKLQIFNGIVKMQCLCGDIQSTSILKKWKLKNHLENFQSE